MDTDSVSLYLHHPGQQPRLVRRVQAAPAGSVYLSIITAEELLHGRLAVIRKHRNRAASVNAYRRLDDLLQVLSRFPRLPFDDAAYGIFAAYPASVKRIGTNDCRISAVAIGRGITVITRNNADFARIPGVNFEDWST